MQHYKRHTYAESTKSTYRTHLTSYLAFCCVCGYAAVPATSETLCQYAVLLAKHLKYSSVKQYLNIVRLLHLEWDIPNPLMNNFQLSCVLRGIRRIHGDIQRKKLPITPELLYKILSMLDLSNSFDASVWAACLTMLYGLLRRGNVLSTQAQFRSSKHLTRNDITFHSYGIQLNIKWSKTIQFGERSLQIPLPRYHGHVLCPVQAILLSFKLSAGADMAGPAFTYKCGPALRLLTPNLFISKIRSCIQQLGLDSCKYAGHSFRRGGASWAYHAGVPLDTIRQLGDWRSNAYQRYIETDNTMLFKAILQMQQCIPVHTSM